MGWNDTPRGNRLHIGIYGKRNSGKSSLINGLTGQDTALVSDTPGTTTDPVFKAMELHPIGPVVFIDTAGFDDEGKLGALRTERTAQVLEKTDIALLVLDGSALTEPWRRGEPLPALLQQEESWRRNLAEKEIPVIAAVNKWDLLAEGPLSESEPEQQGAPSKPEQERLLSGREQERFLSDLSAALGDVPVIPVSGLKRSGLERLRRQLEAMVPEDYLRARILGNLVKEGDLVLLVMPQDIQAPKGRLILPQVQTLRELLDGRCTAVAATEDGLERALAQLRRAPDLIVTDSQCFASVYAKKPAESALTSFSVLFAAYKGDLDVFLNGASSLDDMTEKSRVLIAEACTHVPLSEDIGREKIPGLLRRRFGEDMEIVHVCGDDFPDPEGLRAFDLVIHCGACMFNRKHVMSRIAAAEAAGVPMTNYGVILAKLAGILEKITLPAGSVRKE